MSEGLKKERGQPVMMWNDVVKYLNHQISESLEEMGKEKRNTCNVSKACLRR